MSSSRVVLSDNAEQDLLSIASYIASHDGEARAIEITQRIRATIERIAFMPGIGRSRRQLNANWRSFAVSPWVIFYETLADEDGIYVARVVDGRRDLSSVLGS